MRTPERGQLDVCTIGCPKPPRGLSGQRQTHSHLSATRSFIPNHKVLRKRRIKKVTGSAAEFRLCIFPTAEGAGLSWFARCRGWIPDSLHQSVRSVLTPASGPALHLWADNSCGETSLPSHPSVDRLGHAFQSPATRRPPAAC